MSTIASILAQSKELAGSSVVWADTVSPVMQRYFYDTVLDECVRRTGSLFRRFTSDLVSGTALYCTPALDTIEAVYVLNSAGVKTALSLAHSHDARGGSQYTDAQDGTPTVATFEGVTSLRLDPTPNYNSTAGLTIEGYGAYTPSDYALTDECPLNRQDQTAVVRGVAYYFLEYAGSPRQQAMKELYYKSLTQLEINAHVYTPASRVRGNAAGSAIAGGLNPLNL